MMNCVNKTFLVLVFSLLTTHYSLLAQKGSNCAEDLIPKLGDNKMWGYTNLFGQWVINPSYTKVSPYVENKAVVMKGLSYGVIDCEGNVVLQAQYTKLSNFRYGKIWALNNEGLWGLLNEKGATILAHQYTEINPIAYTELSWVKKDNNLWGLIDEAKGTFICKPQYKIAQIMSENATLVQLNAPTFGVVNHVTCEYLLPHNIYKVKKVAAHTIIFQQEGKWGVFDEWGKIVSNAEYDSIFAIKTIVDEEGGLNDQLLVTRKNNLYGLINLNGKEILAPVFEEIAEFSNGFFRVKQNGKYGFSNRMGKVYIKPTYDYASSFNNGQAIIQKNNKYGVIDFKNQFVLKPQYSYINRNAQYKYYTVREKDKSGSEKIFLYGIDAKKITSQTFDSVFVADTISHTRTITDGKVKYFNIAKKAYAFEENYDRAESFDLGFAKVSKNGKWGIIDLQGKIIVPINYIQIEYFWLANKMVFKTELDGKFGITDIKGKQILANEFDMIANAQPIYIKVKKAGKYGVLKNDGSVITDFTYDFISNEIESPGVPEWPSIVVKKDKYGLLNEKGEEIYQTKAAMIEYVGEGNYSVKEKKNCGLLNSKCSNPYEPKFDAIREFGSGLAAALKNGKWGYITKSGEEKIKPQFNDAGMFIDYMAPVKVGDLWGVIDVNGKLMVPAEYDKYLTLPDGTRKLYKGEKEFTLMKGGKIK